jgi:hypothetical protein
MLPLETVHVFGSGEKSATGPLLVCRETELSSEFQPGPVTVTGVPVEPLVELRIALGPPVTVNALEAVAPPESVTMTNELPGKFRTVNCPKTTPAEFSLQLGTPTAGPVIPGVQVATLPVKPAPATATVTPLAADARERAIWGMMLMGNVAE